MGLNTTTRPLAGDELIRPWLGYAALCAYVAGRSEVSAPRGNRDCADRCFDQITAVGEYGFPGSHPASFALLV